MRRLRAALLAAGLGLVTAGLLWPRAAGPPLSGTTGTGVDVEARPGRELAPGIFEQEKVFTFHGMKIDKIYRSMQGPWARTFTRLAPEYDGGHVWLTRYQAVVVDEGNDAAQEFMCHTIFSVAGASTRGRTYFSIAQGQTDLTLPEGFGIRIENSAARPIDVFAMVLNNRYKEIDRDVDFETTVAYVGEEAAQKLGLKQLGLFGMTVRCRQDDASECQPMKDKLGRVREGHWVVPPGRQVLRTQFDARDTNVHYISMHVHPYAQYMALHDRTDGVTLWRGEVTNHPSEPDILATEHYSSTEGFRLYADHVYEVEVVYDNPTEHDTDAMASLWVYAADLRPRV